MGKVHFIGIGGIGMSAIADIYLARGNRVTGSDICRNDLIGKLASKGAEIKYGHESGNVPDDADLVIRSACITDKNPEFLRARELGKTVITRSEGLKKLLDEFEKAVVVTGTHGKTTTSSLIAFICCHCGIDPTVLVGGEVNDLGGNARAGSGDIIVAELDESDGFFRNVSAKYSVVTHLEREHMENFGDMDGLVGAYREFAKNTKKNGVFIYNGENVYLADIAEGLSSKRISFGIDEEHDYHPAGAEYAKNIRFELVRSGEILGRVESTLIGRHNVMNIMAAAAVCLEAGMQTDKVLEAIGRFKGVKRRFELIGEPGRVKVIEDYAHHPTEIRALIGAAKAFSEGRVISVFQPHRYSRTRDLADEFTECFTESDILVLTDIYSANEDIAANITVHGIMEKMNGRNYEKIGYMEKSNIPGFIAENARAGDVVLLIGAGDIGDVGPSIVEKISERIKV